MSAFGSEPAIILASASGARAALLRHVGVGLRLCPSDVDEEAFKARLTGLGHGGVTLARRLAEEKAVCVSVRQQSALVLGGDQTLVSGSRLFSKAVDRAAATETLMTLSGQDHTLHAAFAFAWRGRLVASGVESATLRMRQLSTKEIDHYLDQVGPAILKSVGCYQVEALGRGLFEAISGDHSAIMGLPLTPVLAFLRSWSRRRGAAAC